LSHAVHDKADGIIIPQHCSVVLVERQGSLRTRILPLGNLFCVCKENFLLLDSGLYLNCLARCGLSIFATTLT
jgi:hypothetical protein